MNLPDVEWVRKEVKKHLGEKEPIEGDIPLSTQSRRVLQLAIEEADSMSDHRASVEHLLIGLLREEEGYGGRLLRDYGIDFEKVRSEISRIRAIRSTDPKANFNDWQLPR